MELDALVNMEVAYRGEMTFVRLVHAAGEVQKRDSGRKFLGQSLLGVEG